METSDTLRKSFPIINGAAEIDHMAICVLSSSIVIQFAPINNMSISCQCPGPAYGTKEDPYSPQCLIMEDFFFLFFGFVFVREKKGVDL